MRRSSDRWMLMAVVLLLAACGSKPHPKPTSAIEYPQISEKTSCAAPEIGDPGPPGSGPPPTPTPSPSPWPLFDPPPVPEPLTPDQIACYQWLDSWSPGSAPAGATIRLLGPDGEVDPSMMLPDGVSPDDFVKDITISEPESLKGQMLCHATLVLEKGCGEFYPDGSECKSDHPWQGVYEINYMLVHTEDDMELSSMTIITSSQRDFGSCTRFHRRLDCAQGYPCLAFSELASAKWCAFQSSFLDVDESVSEHLGTVEVISIDDQGMLVSYTQVQQMPWSSTFDGDECSPAGLSVRMESDGDTTRVIVIETGETTLEKTYVLKPSGLELISTEQIAN